MSVSATIVSAISKMPAPLSLLLWNLGRRGGGPRYTLELARSLMHREDVRLCLALSQQSDLFEQTEALGLPTLAINTYRDAAGFAGGLLRLPAIRQKLSDFIEANRVAVALCSMAHLWNPALAGAIHRGGAKNALVVHDAAPHPGDGHLLRRMMMRNDFRQADLLISLTDQVGKRLVAEQGIAPGKIMTSWLGPFRYQDQAKISARRLGEAPFHLLFFGRLLPYKGLDLLIAAMRILADEQFPVKLRLVGHGPLDLGPLPDNIQLQRGWVAEEAIPSLFDDIDLVVLPYQEASQSGVLPIAQTLAVPSLVTPVGGLLEQVDHGESGFIANEISALGLAQSIRLALSDRPRYDALSAYLAQRGSDPAWNAIADGLVSGLRARFH